MTTAPACICCASMAACDPVRRTPCPRRRELRSSVGGRGRLDLPGKAGHHLDAGVDDIWARGAILLDGFKLSPSVRRGVAAHMA